MLYSETHRLAFIHIHKTGGLSLRAALVGSIPDLREVPELPETHHTLTEFFSVLSAGGRPGPHSSRQRDLPSGRTRGVDLRVLAQQEDRP